MERDDQQVKGSLVLPRLDGSTNFIDYVNNAAKGSNRGIESELIWQTNDSLTLTAALGLLWAEFDRYINADGQNLTGRDQAQAPRYQYSLGLNYQLDPQWTLGASLEGRDDYFFSDRHDTSARAVNLLNARAKYQGNQWYAMVWGKNLLDTTVTVRAFGSFGNDPRKFYVTEPYYQYGAPRTFGVSVGYEL
jgi:outer membrane receptor protein involved in Fe transport